MSSPFTADEMSNFSRKTTRGASPQRPLRRGPCKKTSKSPIRKENPATAKGVIGDPDGHLTRLLATQSYITEVKATFSQNPEIYRKFAFLLSDLKEPSNNTTAVIQEIVHLFEGYPHLIGGLNGFLPPNCELRAQQHAVVVKVHGQTEKRIEETVMKRATDKAGEAIDYINDVKITLGEDSRKYHEFLKVLQEYHHSECGNKTAIRKIIKLLRKYPRLVKGLNAFLPEGYSLEVENKICRINDHTGEISTVLLSHPEGSVKLGKAAK